MKKIYLLERRAGGDRRKERRQYFGPSEDDRRKGPGELPVIAGPGRFFLTKQNYFGQMEH